MKLSEAILLGSTVVSAEAGKLYSAESSSGCALGMAAIAQGCTFVPRDRPLDEKDRRTVNIEEIWGNWLLRMVMRPCECPVKAVPRAMRTKDVITHLFDSHVMEKRNWTLDDLAKWVEMWEPRKKVNLHSSIDDVDDI